VAGSGQRDQDQPIGDDMVEVLRDNVRSARARGWAIGLAASMIFWGVLLVIVSLIIP
jgi:tetrahydromethanopterin S-methyltransferase subunit F